MARLALALLVAAVVALASLGLRAEADKYDVYAVRYATVEGRPASFWVLKGADGRVALVDTGVHRPSRLRRAGARDAMSPAEAVGPLGLEPADVTDVFLTRMTSREAGGIDLFPAARVWIQQSSFDYAAGEAWAEPSLHRGLDPEDLLGLIRRNIAGLMTLVRGDDDVSISGIEFHVGRGDDCRCQYLVVQSHTSRFVLAGDRRDVMAETPDVLVENDPAVFARFPKVADRIVHVE